MNRYRIPCRYEGEDHCSDEAIIISVIPGLLMEHAAKVEIGDPELVVTRSAEAAEAGES